MTNDEMINEMTRYIFEEKSSEKEEIDEEKILIFRKCIELLSIDFKEMMEDLHYSTHLYNEGHSNNSSTKVIPYYILMEILRKYLGKNIDF